MAKRPSPHTGSWLLAEEFLERGDPAFVDELRRINDADRLGAFAAKWLADSRPASRKLLLQYLELPFNAFRHEALIKRLYKLAEKQADDLVMARFLVGTDRSIQRVRRVDHHYDSVTREYWTAERLGIPRGTMLPRDPRTKKHQNPKTGEWQFERSTEKQSRLQLFSVHTRHYLRRRTWRYFRLLGKTDPRRYILAIVEALLLYQDEDLKDGIALLDRWGLMHVLFHHSPVLVARAHGWGIAEGQSLANLSPAPIFESHWQASSQPIIELLLRSRSRPVRQWAIAMLKRHFPVALASQPLVVLLSLVSHEDVELATLGMEALRQSPLLGTLSVDTWLSLIDSANPESLSILCELMEQHLAPSSVRFEDCLRLASSRAVPTARLGFQWLMRRGNFSLQDCQRLLGLFDAECPLIRRELIGWVRNVLAGSEHFSTDWILEMLDSSFLDVRDEGWKWFASESRANHQIRLWQKLLETPYDDIKVQLLEVLEDQSKVVPPGVIDRSQLSPELVRFLWASVLLNIHRGNRQKPQVVQQVVRRIQRYPDDASELLPILAIALRSLRGPEWRSGLTGIIQILESQPHLHPLVASHFPEMQVTPV